MQLLRNDASKYKNNEGEGYMDWNRAKGAEFMYKNFFAEQNEYLKSYLGHSVP